MARGQADFGLYAPKDVGVGISDMGEVAARLGSIVTYDKRGDVVIFDNFEDAILKWEVLVVGAGAYGRLDSTDARSGSQSLKLHTLDEADSEVDVDKGIAILGSKKLGFEVSFSSLGENCDLDLWTVYYDGNFWIQAAFSFDPSTGDLKVMDDTGNFVTVATIADVYSNIFMFHTVKLVADFNLRYYKRLLFDTHEYDISAIKLYRTGAVQAPYLDLGFKLHNRAADGGDVWIDDYVLTQSEP